jgi:hypothetical protein
LGSYAKALGKIGDARAVEPLIAAFKDKDLEMYASDRVDAVKALGMLGDARAVETLTIALKDKYREVGRSAAFALGMLGDSRAVEPLTATLKDSQLHPDVHKSAAEALEKTGWQPGNDENGAWYWTTKHNWAKCTEIGAPAVMALSSALKDIRWQVRLAATETLDEIGDPSAVTSLIAALDDNSWNIRKAAVRALVAIYQGHKLDHQTKQQILALRTKIVNSHRDEVSCNWHFDYGIGVDFPL